MANMLSVITKDGVVEVRLGDKIRLNQEGEAARLGSSGDEARVTSLHMQGSYVMDSMVELVRTGGPHENWGNLRESVTDGMGLHMYLADVLRCFDFHAFPKELCIDKDLMFRGKNLKGLKCKFLHRFKSGDSFVEFEEDIGGCSCDGLGKKGRCIVVNRSSLNERKKSKKEEEAKKEG